MIIDYDDMVKLGKAKSSGHDIFDKKFAVIIKTANSNVGKFNIGSETATKNSIFAFRKNKNHLPEKVQDKISYFLKQAADHFDIEYNLSHKESYDNNILSNSELDKIAADESVILKIANNSYDITNPVMFKTAVEYFMNNESNISPIDRMTVAHELTKVAIDEHCELPKEILAYNRMEKLGSMAKEEFDARRRSSSDEEIIHAINEIEKISSDMSVINFLTCIQDMDKIANYTPLKRKTYYANFLMDLDEEQFDKTASLKEPNDEFISKLI